MFSDVPASGAEHLERLPRDPRARLQLQSHARSVHARRAVQSAIDAVAAVNTRRRDVHAHSRVPDQRNLTGKTF